MKRKLIAIVLGIFVLSALVNYSTTKKDNNSTSTNLFLVFNKAIADDYEVGPPLTNWKHYTTSCTYERTVCVGGGVVPAQVCWKESYTALKDVCGSGTGSCIRSAGC